MTKIVGLTGGIGSGKSTVAKIFESLGYSVYIADERANYLTSNDEEVVNAIKEAFGEEVYDENGQLKRKALGAIVFADREKLSNLNSIVHPATFRDFENWEKGLEDSDYGKGFALKEAAILFESGSYLHADAVLTIYAPKTIRLNRVIQRDETQRDAILDRMDNQWPDSEKILRADFSIFNDGKHLLIPQVQEAAAFFEGKFRG